MFSAILGYLGGRVDRYQSIHEYYGIPVVAAYNPYRYGLMIGQSVYTVDICTDGPSPDWRVGETLAYLKYEQVSGCKRIYGNDLSFKKVTDEVTGKPIIKEIANVTR